MADFFMPVLLAISSFYALFKGKIPIFAHFFAHFKKNPSAVAFTFPILAARIYYNNLTHYHGYKKDSGTRKTDQQNKHWRNNH